MKLFAFIPRGHGSQSFFVMAESEEEAKAAIASKLFMNVGGQWEVEEDGSDASGWGTDYYEMTIYGRGEVAFNDND